MITSDTVTLTMKRPIVITKHPTDMYVLKNKTAKVTVAATGKNLKYVWYVKAPGAKKYTKSKVTTPTYSVKMTAKVDGTMVYCEITDKNKKTETTKPVTLGMVAAGLQFVTENGQVTITDYTGSAKTLVVPPSINGNPVVAIGAEAFLNSKITQLTLPEGLLTIGEYAFSGSALTSLRIPTSITTIPEGACYGCKSLSNVILPDSVKIIGKRAFARCSLLKKMATY